MTRLRAPSGSEAGNKSRSQEVNNVPRIAIIGTGFSGLCVAIQLRKAGIETFTLYEKADRLGGTWRENTYPGIACDVPSHLYSYSFATILAGTVGFVIVSHFPE